MENRDPIPDEPITELLKPELEEPKAKMNVWLKSLSSLALYLIVGYFFFKQNWTLVLILTGVVIFHELGHFLAMKIYRYQELGIFFIPLMGAYVSGKKQEVSQKQSAVILMAGPVPGIIIGLMLHFLSGYFDIRLLEMTAWILIYLNLLNLLPVYPLDGGQLLHRLFLDDYNIIGKIFVVISAALLAYFAWRISFYPLLLFPVLMLSRMIGDIQHERIVSKIEAEGIDLMKSYEEISAEEYWKIRNAVIKYHPHLKSVNPSPPYEFSPKEDQVITVIQNLLQRSIIQDLSIAGKFFILVIWIGCFAAPFFLDVITRPF
jgi:Zn-dependent protease